jgi:predicted transcriptional regulator of viral defense system
MSGLERLLEIAAHQRGFVTTRNAAAAGVDPVQLRKLAQRGRLERCAQGLYRLVAFPHQENDELMRAALWADGRGVISHQSALRLWDLADVNPARVDVTVPAPYRPRRKGGGQYRVWVRPLDPQMIDYVAGIPVVIPERAVIDAAQTGLQRRFVEQAIRTARERKLFGRETEIRIRAQTDVKRS